MSAVSFHGTATYSTHEKPDNSKTVEVIVSVSLGDGTLVMVASIKNGGSTRLENPVKYKTLPKAHLLRSRGRTLVETLVRSGHHGPLARVTVDLR